MRLTTWLRSLPIRDIRINPLFVRLLVIIFAFLVGSTAEAGVVPIVKAQTLTSELVAIRPQLLVRLRFDDEEYVVVDHQWLEQTFIPYFRSFLNHVHAGVQGEGFDCDDFTFLFRAKLVLSNVLAGGARTGEVPCGRLVVAQQQRFGNVPASRSGRHALVLLRTERGWFVIEPQNGTMTPLANYPNLPTVAEILF